MSKFLTHTKDKEENVFAISLIVSCLAEISPNPSDSDVLAEYILNKKHADWSWSYGPHYPKDLDDTFCALIALHKSNHVSQDSVVMAHVVKHLLKTEVSPGGPYKTWIMDHVSHQETTPHQPWNDIDIGVNANVAYFLALQDIDMPHLAHYIDTTCKSMTFTSLYYDSVFPLIYFISRFMSVRKDRSSDHVRGITKMLAGRLIQELHPEGNVGNPLHVALSISTLIYLGHHEMIPVTALNILHTTQKDGAWPGFPLFIETKSAHATKHFTSSDVTTAFALEALHLYAATQEKIQDSKETKTQPPTPEYIMYKAIESRFTFLFSGTSHEFATEARHALHLIQKKHLEYFIALLPFSFKEALRSTNRHTIIETIRNETYINLGLANLLGWIGYTIQDTIIDEHTDMHLLPFSNVCIRHAYMLCTKETLTDSMNSYIDTAFTCMDSANQQELRGICTPITSANKSFGHALGPLILFSRCGFAPKSPAFIHLETFFREYLIARQMLDDAHDIQEDAAQGRTNSVHNLFPDISSETLSRDLWSTYIEKICGHIDDHIYKAQEACNSIRHILDLSFGETLLQPLIQSNKKALTERAFAVNFLAEYNKPTPSFSCES